MAISDLTGVAYPWRKGENGYPEEATGAELVVRNVISLLSIASGELPMGQGIGASVWTFTFENLGPLTEARISQSIRTVVARNEPRMRIVSIDMRSESKSFGGVITAYITYEIGDVSGTFNVDVGTFAGAL